VALLSEQLRALGAADEMIEPVLAKLRHFASTGEGFSGVVPLPGTPVLLECVFSGQAHVTSRIRVSNRSLRGRHGGSHGHHDGRGLERRGR
jgi:hypothetical protein